MERIRRTPGLNIKKKKMTREQLQLACIKKKECDALALKIVEKLLEPQVDSEWLLENLQNINRCHVEDVIEERAITKVCGYVLCQKPLKVIIKQQYHISLRDKKVYDVTKRKNFCSSSCFGASNYLLEQMFTSPLWLRDSEKIPKFRIFSRNKINQNSRSGEEVDISLVKPSLNNLNCENDLEENNKSKTKNQVNNTVPNESTKEISDCIENFVLKTNLNAQNSINFKNNDHIVRHVHFAKGDENEENGELHLEQKVSIQSTNNFENEKVLSSAISDIVTVNTNNSTENSDSKNLLSLSNSVEKSNKSRILKKKRTETKPPVDINLTARIESSFHEWITQETIDFLFGDDSTKKKVIEKIEHQDKYSILCQKLNRLQFQDEQEDDAILEKPNLKPAPHFAILKEEGEKLDIKVRAFYKGNTAIEEPLASVTNKETENDNTVMPLTDNHAPQIIRRKIFLERLDEVMSDLLRTLAGSTDVYTLASANYTSVRCTAIKALINTFSLSAKNIIFKTAEWTLIGLVIIKMLSLLDPWLATLLVSKKANMYISMILTSYKLDPHYLHLFVASFNPNVNLK